MLLPSVPPTKGLGEDLRAIASQINEAIRFSKHFSGLRENFKL